MSDLNAVADQLAASLRSDLITIRGIEQAARDLNVEITPYQLGTPVGDSNAN